MSEKQRKTIQWTPEQRAQHQAIRDAFRDWHPGPEESIASGAARSERRPLPCARAAPAAESVARGGRGELGGGVGPLRHRSGGSSSSGRTYGGLSGKGCHGLSFTFHLAIRSTD